MDTDDGMGTSNHLTKIILRYNVECLGPEINQSAYMDSKCTTFSILSYTVY